jgi:hypothetical protein
MGTIETRDSDSPVIKDLYKNIIQKGYYDKDVKKLSKALHLKMAKDVRLWRVTGDGKSWRAISTLFAIKYPEFAEKHNIVAENQLSGVYLCDAAMIKLDETELNWD